MVRHMVLRYMRNPRSIMLTVVPANVDVATQEIIELAREVDPSGDRTLRILTKPDLVDKGTENKVINMIEDENSGGQLGWVLVRNLGQQQLEDGNADRDAEEELFHQTAPWDRLRPENFGIKALKNRLRDVLCSTVRREFPSVRITRHESGKREPTNKFDVLLQVRNEISKQLAAAKASLARLGDERETPEQQRRLMLDIVATFQDITQQALATNYGVRDIFDSDRELRLATLVATRYAAFSHDLALWGHQYAFKPKGDEPHGRKSDDENRESESAGDQNYIDGGDGGDDTGARPPKSQHTSSRKVTKCDDLEGILYEDAPIERSMQSGIIAWIGQVYNGARGFEIGTFNHVLLATLMKKQSAKWPDIARGFVSDIIATVHIFIQRALSAACHDSRVASNILSLLMDNLMDKYRQAISSVDFLLDIERAGTPMTMNHYLNDNIRKW